MSKAEKKTTGKKTSKSQFTIKLDNSKILKTIVETLSKIFDEANFIVSPKELTVKGMDPSRICLIELHFKKGDFDEFQCNKECKVGLNLDDFDKILKRASSNDALELIFKEAEQKLKIKMIREESTKSRVFSLASLELDIEDPPLDKLKSVEYPAIWSIETDFLVEALKDGEIYSEILNIEATENKGLLFASWGAIGEMEYQLGLEDLISNDLSDTQAGSFSITFLKSIMKLSDITEELEISAKTDHPIKLFFKLLEGAELEYYLAPRVEQEDFEKSEEIEGSEIVEEEEE
ncbi:MAG: proliferating cell nuclear antigen (pcna) [Candidatus Lokiarchaeota archaeon]|nr:proliferating cell nuclear antigen (pcna) [Candidatus Lokiarchaeota archaeon]